MENTTSSTKGIYPNKVFKEIARLELLKNIVLFFQ
jgi:hypothetical protein